MAATIVMPQMGYDMKEGTVVQWVKKEGEAVTRGEVIAEIETDKATVEFEAFTTGVLRKIYVEAGVPVPVGQLIAVITAPDEEAPVVGEAAPSVQAAGAAPAAPAPKSAPAKPDAPTPAETETRAATEAEAVAPTREVRASPIARRLAKERGLDLSKVSGTGPQGRVTEKDVEFYVEAAPAPASVAEEPPASPAEAQVVELSRMRQAIARVTADSKREAPHFYVTAEVDMTKAISLRRDINSAVPEESKVSVNDLIIKACTGALQRYPKFNSFFNGDHLEMHASVNMGIAIALEAGLMVPGINNCASKSLTQIASASKDLIARAHQGQLRSNEYGGTTFSISNLGMFDVESFSAIIYPPHAAVLAVGRVKDQPVVRDGSVVVAQMMKTTVSVDHRVADGAEAAQFLVEVKKLLENPASLLL